MAEKDVIIQEKLQYAGLLNYKEVYNYAYEWLTEEKYNVTEEKYQEKISGNAREVEIKWEAWRKVTDYFKYQINIGWRINGMTDVEVEIDGKKKKMQKAVYVEVKTKGTLIKDWQSTWESTPIYQFLREVYNKYIIRTRTDQMEDKIIADIKDFNAEIKAMLELTGRK